MAYQHPRLAQALAWKWPGLQHVTTCNGWLTGWPSDRPYPTEAQLAQWVAEYEAVPADDPAKDQRAAWLKQVQQATTLDEIKAVLRQWMMQH